MRKRILIGVVVAVLLMGVGFLVGVSNVDMVEAKKLTPSDGMIVFYTTSNSTYLFWCQLEGTDIIDQGDKWDVHSEQGTWIGVNKATVAFDYFRYKKIEADYQGSINDLNLTPLSGMELPKSQHIGKLIAVNPTLAKPATVTRKYEGQLYNVQCLATQDIVDMWLTGELQIGDYVVVSYIEEIPETQEIGMAIVTDKVYESW